MNPGDDISNGGGGDYERPGNRHRCGRGAVWRKPCGAGPSPDGHCGGVAECAPLLRNGKFECNRPASAGGPCAEGPKPDGACTQCRPPCVPRLTLRSRRGRMTWQIGALLLLLLAAGFHFGRGAKKMSVAIDPGPLSAKHGHFTASQGCAACHSAHEADLGGWVKAAFTPGDMNGKCAACHAFDGDAASPHNEDGLLGDGSKVRTRMAANAAASPSPPAEGGEGRGEEGRSVGLPLSPALSPLVPRGERESKRPPLLANGSRQASNTSLRETDCRMCHTEHRGANAKLTTLTDAQCNTCHQVKMESFTRGHPAFPSNFPRVVQPGVRFNHATHLLDFFKQPEFAARAQQSCVECHAGSPTERDVRTAGFDEACARCHAGQIPQNELVLLRLPEPVLPDEAAQLGADDATAFMAWWLQRSDGTNYGIALQQWLAATAKDGVTPLAKALAAQIQSNLEPALQAVGTQHVTSASLLAGLSPELLQRPAQLWTNQQKFEPSAVTAPSGWYWMEDMHPELHYKPAGHADAVARAWIEFAISDLAGGSNDETDAKRAGAFRSEVAHRSAGVGRCLKCHVVSETSLVEWGYRPAPVQAHTKFSHGAHIRLMRCEDCHALNPAADYEAQFKTPTAAPMAGVSHFKSIALPNCASCHAENKVRNDCALCHEYHRAPSLKEIAVTK